MRAKNLCAWVLSGFIIFALTSYTVTTAALTLDEAKKIARENNPDVIASRAELDANEATLTRSSSRFFPRIGVESRYEYFDSAFERRRGGTGNLFAEWNLFNGLQDFAARRAQSLDVDVARLKLEVAEENIGWIVESAYAKVIANQDSIVLYKAALERNSGNQKTAKSRRLAGVVSDADVLEFDLYESILRADLAAAEGDLKEAEAQFRTILGEEKISFPLTGVIQRYRLLTPVEEIIGSLATNNVEIKTAKLDVERADAEKTVANGGFLPQVRAFASHGSLGLRETVVSPETYAGVVARWELFSGFDTVGARREAAARVIHAESHLRSTLIAKRGEIEQTIARLKALEFRIDLEEKNHETAHRYMRTVNDEYRRGVKNSPDLKSSTDNVLQSHLREVKLRQQYLEQASELRKQVAGKISFEKISVEKRREEP